MTDPARDTWAVLLAGDHSGVSQNGEVPGNPRKMNTAALGDLGHREGPMGHDEAAEDHQTAGIREGSEELGVELLMERRAAVLGVRGARRHGAMVACLRNYASTLLNSG